MSVAILTIDGKKYAVIPIEQYLQAFDEHGVRVLREDEMTEQDREDLAEFHRLENEQELDYEEARKELGLK